VTLDLEERNSVQDEGENPQKLRHVSLSLTTIESLFDLVKYCFWSGEATPGVGRPVTICWMFGGRGTSQSQNGTDEPDA